MLTHNILADEQGYRQLANVFSHNEAFIKKEDDHIAFFADVLEPACEAYRSRRPGEMFAVIGGRRPAIQSMAEKREWTRDMDRLQELRDTGRVGDIMDHLMETRRPRLPASVEHDELELRRLAGAPDAEKPDWAERLELLREVPYREVVAVTAFINGQTPFSTKHGVKGAQFENVLVVVGRGWGQYDFNQMLEYSITGVSSDAKKLAAYERARNLFYVCCSRSERHLAVLFTLQLSDTALTALRGWFGSENVQPLSLA
jgi:DNA helicase-2/ATP-dependent DNA helicase PcrA